MDRDLLDLIQEDRDIIYDRHFFEILKDNSLLEFRKRIDFVQSIRSSMYLEKKVHKYYDELLSQYDTNSKMFFRYKEVVKVFKNDDYEFLSNYEDFDYLIDRSLMVRLQDYWHYSDRLDLVYKELVKRTNIKIGEIIIDGLFGDTIYNVWINIREMLRYNSLLNEDEKLIKDGKINFYELILNIDEISCEEKIELYNKLKDKNIALMFYNDLRSFKDDSYKKIKNSLFDFHNYDSSFNSVKSLEHGIPIYELETEKFCMLVSCRDRYNEVDCIKRHCYSLITETNRKVYRKDRFVYGYVNIDINMILHVFEKDSYSSNGNGLSKNSFTTDLVNRLLTLEQFRNLEKYNEIQIMNKRINENTFEVMKPAYLVIFDKMETRYIDEAKRLNIPIIKIKPESYVSKEKRGSVGLNYEKIKDDYTNGSYKEEDRIIRRLLRK